MQPLLQLRLLPLLQHHFVFHQQLEQHLQLLQQLPMVCLPATRLLPQQQLLPQQRSQKPFVQCDALK
jgi:hypothetical protein